jgi:Ca-activated chloride channel homolog
MAQQERLEVVKDALRLLVSRLDRGDRVAIVTFGDDSRVVLEPTGIDQEHDILRAIDSLQPDGSTNLEAGLRMGYDLARRTLSEDGIDRIVLASDGVANVGLTDAEGILAGIRRDAAAGIELVSVGVGMGNFNDALLEQLADRGNGFYAYINDQAEADRVFGSQLTGTLDTIARDARVQVEFNPSAVAAYRLLGYENRAMPDQDFSNPNADAGEVGAGHSVTALYEIQPTWTGGPTLGEVRLHWIDPDTDARLALNADITTSAFAPDFYSSTPSFRLAATVGGFAELLRQSPYASGYTLADVAREATSVMGSLDGQVAVVEFAQLAQTAAGLNRATTNDW